MVAVSEVVADFRAAAVGASTLEHRAVTVKSVV